MAARMHTTGVKVSMRRTITPAKYTAVVAYRTTAIKAYDVEEEVFIVTDK